MRYYKVYCKASMPEFDFWYLTCCLNEKNAIKRAKLYCKEHNQKIKYYQLTATSKVITCNKYGN